MTRRFFTVLLLFLGAAAAQVGGQKAQNATVTPEAQEDLLQNGLEAYKKYYCGMCHRLDAARAKGTFGPPHNTMGIIAGARIQDPSYSGEATTPAEYIRESIVQPKAYVVPGHVVTPHEMPAYTQLAEEELGALVYLLLVQ